jgi:hypothetical protein
LGGKREERESQEKREEKKQKTPIGSLQWCVLSVV